MAIGLLPIALLVAAISVAGCGGDSTNFAQVLVGPAPSGAACTSGISGQFTPTGGMMFEARAGHAAAITGTANTAPVLIAGGLGLLEPGAIPILGLVLNGAELYDPVANQFIPTQPDGVTPIAMKENRALFTATYILSINKVLVTGGATLIDPTGLPLVITNSAELFDPASRTFTATTGKMAVPRAGHTATLLQDGTVLITGGVLQVLPPPTVVSNNAEIFNPATGTFAAVTATMANGRVFHTATLMTAGPLSGKVLVAGGVGLNGGLNNLLVLNNSADIYDPATQTFTAVPGGMKQTRQFHAASALNDGRVLITGGVVTLPGLSLFLPTVSTSSAEIFLPGNTVATSSFTPTSNSMTSARALHTSNTLGTGKVLVAGGLGLDSLANLLVAQTADLFDPATNTFSATGLMSNPRDLHSATVLNCGKVLLAGGILSLPNLGQKTAEVYSP